MTDQRSDEKLVTAFLAGDEPSFTELFNRYAEPLWRFAWNQSRHRDNPTVDAVRQVMFLTIFKGLKKGGFNPDKGSFKNWVYGICRKVCMSENRNLRRQPQTFTERYPDSASGGPDDIADQRPEPDDYDQTQSALDKALSELTDEDRQLLLLIVENKTYEEIHQIPPFDKETLVNLRQKTCRARRILVTLMHNK